MAPRSSATGLLTAKGIFERGESAVVPESWLIGADKGVGRAVRGQTESLFDET